MGAVADVLIPPDDFRGGRDAGVVHYIDRQLTRKYKRHQQTYREILAKLDAAAAARSGRTFAESDEPVRAAIVADWEKGPDSPIFTLVLGHAMQGFYGNPRHGGNHNAVSWQMLGVPTVPVRGRLHYSLPPATKWSKGS